MNNLIEDLEQKIANALPHGSGIDADWHVEIRKTGLVVCSNSYHCMCESGMYDGWQDFKVTFNLLDDWADDFRLAFVGDQYLARKHDLRPYLEDTIYFALNDLMTS